jgi:hypothetical protein
MKTINVASIKKGPKGIWELIFRFLFMRDGMEKKVPSSEAMKIKDNALIGLPASMPSTKAILTSPPPIH